MTLPAAPPQGPPPPAPAERDAPSSLTLLLVTVVMCLIWGSTWLVIREGLDDLPPLTSAGARFALAALVMLVLAPRIARAEGGARPTRSLVLAMGLCNFGLSYGIVYWTETVLPSGLVSVLWSVFPMFMAIAGHLALPGERLVGRQWLGFAVGLGGVVLLFRTDVMAVGAAAVPVALVLLVSPLVSTFGTTWVKRHGAGTSSALLNRDGMVVGALVLLGAAALLERGEPVAWTARAVGSVLYLSLVGTVVSFGLYFWAMRYVPAYRLSLIAYVVPVIALTLGATVGGEPLRASTVAGTALILSGLGLVLLGKRAPARDRAGARALSEREGNADR